MEPRPEIRGDIARTYMYMDKAYPGHGIISQSNRKLFEAWAKEDPVDDRERERARKIEAIQGNRNPFIWGETHSGMNGSIIGNRSSKIYHRPDCPDYAKIAPENRVPFASEEEALAAGYRVAGNCW